MVGECRVASRRDFVVCLHMSRCRAQQRAEDRCAVLWLTVHCSLFRRARLRPRRGSRVRCTCELPAGRLLLARAIFHSRIRNHECDKCVAWRTLLEHSSNHSASQRSAPKRRRLRTPRAHSKRPAFQFQAICGALDGARLFALGGDWALEVRKSILHAL